MELPERVKAENTPEMTINVHTHRNGRKKHSTMCKYAEEVILWGNLTGIKEKHHNCGNKTTSFLNRSIGF